jgi:hypothetical protein
MVKATEPHRPDRDTIGGSTGCRDYPMSTYDLCARRIGHRFKRTVWRPHPIRFAPHVDFVLILMGDAES